MQKGDQLKLKKKRWGLWGGGGGAGRWGKKMTTSAQVKKKVTIFTNGANKKFLLN